MVSRAAEDGRRFQRWQRDALSHPPAGAEVHSVGPFRVELPADGSGFTWVTIVDQDVREQDVRDSVEPLRAMFRGREGELQVELNEAALPHAGAWLEACGFRLVERNPLMACRPADFRPFASLDVSLMRLDPTASKEDLEAFQRLRWTEGNLGAAAPPVDKLRRELESATSVYLLAWLDGEPVGTGVSHALMGAAEIVGIVTRADRRRRGVAATVSSELVSRHLSTGGDFVFLDAANEEASRVYSRLGFRDFGANLVYRYA